MNIKQQILLRKAKKIFEQYPNKTSTIMKIKIGDVLTHWKVQRQNNQYAITEVCSSKKTLIFKEDKTNVGGVGGKQFEYDPERKGTGTVGPEDDTPAAVRMQQASQAIRSGPSAQKFEPHGVPPPLPAGQEQIGKKIDRIAQGKNHFDRNVMQRVAQQLSDKEFGQYYGIPKKSALSQSKTPPPLPSKVSRTGMKSYPQKITPSKATTLTMGSNKKGKSLREASPAFSKISSAFMDYMSRPTDHVAQSNFINTISREKNSLVNKQEKDSVASIEGQYLGQATKATDSSTKQTPLAGMQQKQQLPRQSLTAGKEIPQTKYRIILREAGEIEGGLDSSQEGETPLEDVPEQEPIEKKTSEEQAINKLSGQTIKKAEIRFDENIGKLSMELAGHHQPAELEWNRSGRIIFSFKGQKYILKK